MVKSDETENDSKTKDGLFFNGSFCDWEIIIFNETKGFIEKGNCCQFRHKKSSF